MGRSPPLPHHPQRRRQRGTADAQYAGRSGMINIKRDDALLHLLTGHYPTLTARPPPASRKPPPRASQRSFRGRGGRRFRKPGTRACRFERLSGNWESTGPPSGNTWTPRVLQRSDPGRILRRQLLIRWRPIRVSFLLNTQADIYPEQRHPGGTFCRRP